MSTAIDVTSPSTQFEGSDGHVVSDWNVGTAAVAGPCAVTGADRPAHRSVTTPTLFLGGREDWNVPVLNAELFYQSLRTRGIDTQLVVYPGMHHGGWTPEFERDYLDRVRAWFDKYLK